MTVRTRPSSPSEEGRLQTYHPFALLLVRPVAPSYSQPRVWARRSSPGGCQHPAGFFVLVCLRFPIDAHVPILGGKDLHQFPALVRLLVCVLLDILNLLRVQLLVGVRHCSPSFPSSMSLILAPKPTPAAMTTAINRPSANLLVLIPQPPSLFVPTLS